MKLNLMFDVRSQASDLSQAHRPRKGSAHRLLNFRAGGRRLISHRLTGGREKARLKASEFSCRRQASDLSQAHRPRKG